MNESKTFNVAIINSDEINKKELKNEYDLIVGVETGCKVISEFAYLQKNSKEICFMGDFDSSKFKNAQKYLENIKIDTKNKTFQKFKTKKDLSDTEMAINYVNNKYKNNVNITLYAKNGGRLDHQYTFFNYLRIYDNLKIVDNQNMMFVLDAGENFINKYKTYKYISFFSLQDVHKLNINGFKYDLEEYELLEHDNSCLSNEMISNIAKVSFEEGKLLVIFSKD